MNLTLPDLGHLILSTASLLLLAGMVASFSNRLSIPVVLGEILLGILIGPTCMGMLYPAGSEWLFPIAGETGEAMRHLSRFAVISLLFVAGMETNLAELQREAGKTTVIALGSSLIPFVTGFLIVMLNPGLFRAPPDHSGLLSCFLGVALSISALPVIIRILLDLNLYRSRIGVITVSAASLMDIMGWTAFALILSRLNPASSLDIAGMLGAHCTLLSFMAGIIIGNSPYVHERIKKWAYSLVIPFVSPLFFLSIGAKVNFVENWDIALIAVVIVAATFSKVSGTFLGARTVGLGGREALAAGFALNVRGAMEIILSTEALEAGLIDTNLFVALVVMALFTSLLSVPALKFLVLNQPVPKSEGCAIPGMSPRIN